MWKHLLFFGFLTVVYCTPVYENGMSKEDLDLSLKQLRTEEDLAQAYWEVETYESTERIKSMYNTNIQNILEKIEFTINDSIRNSTDYIMSKIIPFFTQSEKNRELLQCIDMKKTVEVTNDAVGKNLLHVHKCKWNAIRQVLDDVYVIKDYLLTQVQLNIKESVAHKSKCIEDAGSTSKTQTLRCFAEVKEKVLQFKEGVKSFLEHYEASQNETVTIHVNTLNECNRQIDFSEGKKAQDEQFDKIEKCLSEYKNESSESMTIVKNEMSSQDMLDFANKFMMYIQEKSDDALFLIEYKNKLSQSEIDLADRNLDEAERLRLIQFIEQKWQANGHENKSLSTALTAEEYSTLLECPKEYTTCSSFIYDKGFSGFQVLAYALDIVTFSGAERILSEIKEQSAECMANLNNISTFYDAVLCILRVDGQANNVLVDSSSELSVGNKIILEELESQVKDVDNCDPSAPFKSRINAVENCFSSKYEQTGNVIFNS